MKNVFESLLTAPNGKTLNAGLEAAGSDRFLQRCGAESHLWQPMRGDQVVGWPAGFVDARKTVVLAAEEDARYQDEGPA